MKIPTTAIFIVATLSCVMAHSWNDVYYVQSDPSNKGYPRAYPGHIDDIMVRKIEQDSPNENPCQGPNGSHADNTAYSDEHPMLSVNAGDVIETTYSENGHVTKDQYPGGDIQPGQTQFYWSGGDPNVQLEKYSDLNDEHKLGDAQNFDDGVCGEDNTKGRAGPLQCKNTFSFPKDTKTGIYQVVWLWKFTKFGDKNHFEWYSTCADFKVNGGESQAGSAVAGSAIADAVKKLASTSVPDDTRTTTSLSTATVTATDTATADPLILVLTVTAKPTETPGAPQICRRKWQAKH